MSPVVAEAQGWVGTPFVHGASACGQGADCLGLVLGIWRAFNLPALHVPAYSAEWFCRERPPSLITEMAAHFASAGPHWGRGDVLVFRLKPSRPPQHLGILTEIGPKPRFVHALDRRGVVDVGLTPAWQRRVVTRFRFPIHEHGVRPESGVSIMIGEKNHGLSAGSLHKGMNI